MLHSGFDLVGFRDRGILLDLELMKDAVSDSRESPH